MKIRTHAGGLEESMATVAEIEPTAAAIADYITEQWAPLLPPGGIKPGQITVEPYGGIDDRIGWDTHIVRIDGKAIFGFTDGPLP